MKRFMNSPDKYIDEMLEGILKAHPNRLRSVTEDRRAIVRREAPIQNKVGIATGGGSGHLPIFMGYVGRGLLDGAAIGNIFSSPNPSQMLAVTKAIHGGKGVLYLYGNYDGDIWNFDLAAELADAMGIRVESIRVADDVASAPKHDQDKRRGIAGLFFAYKVAGAKAMSEAGLDEVVQTTKKALAGIRSMGVALSSCSLPAVGTPIFTIGDNEMEIGMGIHGEPGIERRELLSADEVTEIVLTKILEDLPYRSGSEVAVLVNGLGATPKEELYIIFNRVFDLLHMRGIRVFRSYVGEFATSLEMAGCSITLMLLDAELKALLAAPASTPFFCQSHDY